MSEQSNFLRASDATKTYQQHLADLPTECDALEHAIRQAAMEGKSFIEVWNLSNTAYDILDSVGYAVARYSRECGLNCCKHSGHSTLYILSPCQ